MSFVNASLSGAGLGTVDAYDIAGCDLKHLDCGRLDAAACDKDKAKVRAGLEQLADVRKFVGSVGGLAALTNAVLDPAAAVSAADLPRVALLRATLGSIDASVGVSLFTEVRKTPSWPRSWANFSLSQLSSHRYAWANLHLLGQPDISLAPGGAARRRRDRRRAARGEQGATYRGFKGAHLNPLGLFLEPPGPLLTHLHTVYMAYSECLPTRLNPLAERTCFSQVAMVGSKLGMLSNYYKAKLSAQVRKTLTWPRSWANFSLV